MMYSSMRSRFLSACIALAAIQAPLVAQNAAPAKKALGVEDYSRWRSINSSAISGDGKWVTYVLAQTNTAPADAKPVLHILRLDNNQDIEVANATAPAFSTDSSSSARYSVSVSRTRPRLTRNLRWTRRKPLSSSCCSR